MALNPLEGDLIDPADEDWTQADDGTVYYAAQAGIPQAVSELKRREQAEQTKSAS